MLLLPPLTQMLVASYDWCVTHQVLGAGVLVTLPPVMPLPLRRMTAGSSERAERVCKSPPSYSPAAGRCSASPRSGSSTACAKKKLRRARLDGKVQPPAVRLGPTLCEPLSGKRPKLVGIAHASRITSYVAKGNLLVGLRTNNLPLERAIGGWDG
jgi:hypothetical protein